MYIPLSVHSAFTVSYKFINHIDVGTAFDVQQIFTITLDRSVIEQYSTHFQKRMCNLNRL